MKHNVLRTGVSLLLLLAMLAAALPSVFAAEGGGNLYITGYTVTDASGRSVGSISKGNTVNITVSVKDTGDGTGSGDPKTLDITKLDDSFTGGSLTVEKTSSESAPLVYAVRLTGLTYKGVGQSLKLQVGTAGDAGSYQTLEVTITEAVVYEAPTSVPEPPSAPDSAPAPMVLISRSELEKPIESGQEVKLKITFQNLSNIKLKSPVVTFTPSDGLLLESGTSSFPLADIAGKKSVSLEITVKGASAIPSPAQSLGAELKFNYNNNVSTVQGSVTDKISIPAIGRESVPQPVVLVTRSTLPHPLAVDETATVTLRFQNTSSTPLVKPVVAVTPSESLMILNDAATFLLPDIQPGSTASLDVQIQVARGNSSTSQTLSTELKYGYDNGGMMTQASVSDKVVVPTLAKETVPQPVVLVTRSATGKPISAGETLPVTLTFQNAGTTALVKPVVSVTTSESLILMDPTSTFLLPDLAPGKSTSISVKVQATKELSSTNQSLNTELKYLYDNGETMTQATSSDKVNIAANASSKSDTSVPNVVVRSYSYGESSVPSGSSFPLNFTFENTGAVPISNVVVTVDGGETFTMDASTNTYFYKALAAGASQTQEIPMRAVPTGKSGAQGLTLSFKYEYVAGEKRTQASSDVKLSIPVYQPDRFQITAPSVLETVNMGEETELLLTYVNKGKDDLANLEATVEGEGVDTPARTQYLGNVTAGANGNIGFALTPNTEGDVKVVLKISYENADQQIQTREFPVILHVTAPPPPEDFPDDFDPDMGEGGFPWLIVGPVVGVVVLAGAAGLLLWKKKKGSKPDDSSWDDWDDTPPSSEGE